MDSIAPSAQKLLHVACAVLGIGILVALATRSVNDPLWADELLTAYLLQADSLPRLWAGITRGIDGNPPLYLTAAWLLTRLLPASIPAVAFLKLLNLVLAAAGLAALWRLARRVASALACWAGTLIVITLNENFLFAAFELRTYATYFAAAALAVLMQQRLLERSRSRDGLGLALVFLALTLAHTFGIAYVGCIALAGWLSSPRHKAAVRLMLLAVAPSIVVMLAWIPFLREQLKVADPYGWITRPGWPELAETLFSSQLMMWISLVALLCLAMTGAAGMRRKPVPSGDLVAGEYWQPTRYLGLVAAGFTALALVGWIVSLAAFPIFVPRFFIPQLIVSFLLMAALAEWLLAAAKRRRALVLFAGVVLTALMLRNVVTHAVVPFHGDVVCVDAGGAYFETTHLAGDLPVIADSPHVFLPRAAYAPHAEAYRFPLDSDVVQNYPTRARGNAVDYHILQALQTWLPLPQVMETDEIVRNHPQFLVIETPARAWLEHLRATRKVEAEQLARSVSRGPDDVVCSLWKVTAVAP